MPFGRKRVGGYGTGRQRKFASLQLARDAKASRVEFANEPAATTSSSSTITMPMVPAKMARSVSLILIFHIFTMIVHMIQIYIHLCFVQTSLAFVA